MLKGLGRTAPRLGDRPVRFAFIEGVAQTEAILTGLIGSYGKTKGAPALLVGIVKSGPLAHESLAFTMEYLILEATRHNIGSCWISGTFDRQRLAGELTLADGEEIPVVAPVGYPAAQPGLRPISHSKGSRIRPSQAFERDCVRRSLGRQLRGAAGWAARSEEAGGGGADARHRPSIASPGA